MVEMLEARNAIVHATQNSLILFDEIGRGTSTYDGMALAQAIIEYIHDHIGAKTLFSTHYHELTVLEKELDQLKNVHVSAVEQNGKLVFLHKVKEGAADKSYGIHVAELANLPQTLIKRAKEILTDLESTGASPSNKEKTDENEKKDSKTSVKQEVEQLSFFDEEQKTEPKAAVTPREKEAARALKALNLLETTPLEALNKLYELQKILNQ